MARYEVIFEATGDGLILMDTQYPVENGKTLDAEVAEFSETDAGERAAACLNALDGIPDPAAFVEAARKVVQPNRSLASWMRLAAHRGVGTSFASPSDTELLKAEAEASRALDKLEQALSGKAVG